MSARVRLGALVAVAALMLAAAAAIYAPRAESQSAGSGATVVQEAQSWLGTPYVWGGASRSGVDCSGLIMAVFQNVGVSLPHSSQAQINYGSPVAQPAAGDLVFSDYGYGYASHVGIATGDGQMINAPYPGTVVRYDPIVEQNVNGYRSIL